MVEVCAEEALVGLFGDRNQTLTILLCLLIGPLIAFTQYSGGMKGFVERVSRAGLATTPRSASVLAWFMGLVVFVEGNIGTFVSGPVNRPIFDRLRISREKLAYLLDSVAAPKATVLPLNSWGAYIIGLLAAQNIEQPLRAMLSAIPLNLYALLAIGGSLVVAWTGLNLGPMKAAERRVQEDGGFLDPGTEPMVADSVITTEAKEGIPARALNLIVPILTLVVAVLVGLFITGDGNLMDGDGTLTVFWALALAVAAGGVLYLIQGIVTVHEATDLFTRGIGGMIPIGLVLMLAFVMGAVCNDMGTGVYVAGIVEAGLPRFTIPAALFVVCLLYTSDAADDYFWV